MCRIHEGPQRLSLPFGVLISRFFIGKGAAADDNEKNTTPYNENEQPEYGTIYFPCQMTSSASCPAEQEDEFKVE